MDEFIKDHKYVFVAKKYLKWKRRNDKKSKAIWYKDINGVQFLATDNATSLEVQEGYAVSRCWCKEVELTPREKKLIEDGDYANLGLFLAADFYRDDSSSFELEEVPF